MDVGGLVREHNHDGVLRAPAETRQRPQPHLRTIVHVEHDDVDRRRRDDGVGLDPVCGLEHVGPLASDPFPESRTDTLRLVDEKNHHAITLPPWALAAVGDSAAAS
jgi:hypothetical protein